MGADGILTIIAIVLVGLVIFWVYFIFKVVEFVVTSVDLYKKMVAKQDAMVKLLMDIRDQTKRFHENDHPELTASSMSPVREQGAQMGIVEPPQTEEAGQAAGDPPNASGKCDVCGLQLTNPLHYRHCPSRVNTPSGPEGR